MKVNILVCLVLAAAVLPGLVLSVGVDLGDCACMCGLETAGGVIGPDGHTSTVSETTRRALSDTMC